MTRDQAEKAARLLEQIKDHELADSKIRGLHKKASDGDQESLDKLTNICLELNNTAIEGLERQISELQGN